jgi:hypothetical protein
MAYIPRYLSLNDVPFSGVPDDFDDEDKSDALELAESRFDADFNDGQPFDPDEIEGIHRTAIKALATHVLTLLPEDSNSTKVGDLASGPEGILEYSSEWKKLYNEQLSAATMASDDAGEERSGHVYTTHQ